jgi:HD-GYP domain-containing protein (c-di-GMP phosphodiesterase class II)
MPSARTTTGSSSTTSATDLPTSAWDSRPALAFAIRATAFGLPILAAVVVVYLLDQRFRPDGIAPRVGWFILMVAVSMVISRTLVRFTRRAAPVAALYRMSLVFPDEAPSRFTIALKSESVPALKRRLAAGDLSEPEAARAIVMLISRLSKHDRMTRGHSERVRAYSDMIAEEMGLDDEDRQKLQWAALTHDLGKLVVPASILNSPDKPTDEEWRSLREHPEAGAFYARSLAPWLGEWSLAASEHHERWDGGGYPSGLAGEEISLAGRIVAVADAYDVMTSVRSYKEALKPEIARAELSRNAGTQFDPMPVRAFLAAGVDLSDMRWSGLAGLSSLIPRLGDVAMSATATVTTAAAVTTAAVVGVPAVSEPNAPEQLAAVDESVERAILPPLPGVTTAAPATVGVIEAVPTTDGAPTTTAPATTAAPTSSADTTDAPATTSGATTSTNRVTTTVRATTTTARATTTTRRTTTTARATTTTAAPTTTTTQATTTTVVTGPTETLSDFDNVEFLASPPAVVAEGVADLDHDDKARMWFEVGPVAVPAGGLVVNAVNIGDYDGESDPSKTVPKGTIVCSYLVHSDRQSNKPWAELDGSFETDGKVLALIWDTEKLENSSFLEAPGTSYAEYSGAGRNDELTLKRDRVEWDFSVRAFSPTDFDQVRVITEC